MVSFSPIRFTYSNTDGHKCPSQAIIVSACVYTTGIHQLFSLPRIGTCEFTGLSAWHLRIMPRAWSATHRDPRRDTCGNSRTESWFAVPRAQMRGLLCSATAVLSAWVCSYGSIVVPNSPISARCRGVNLCSSSLRCTPMVSLPAATVVVNHRSMPFKTNTRKNVP